MAQPIYFPSIHQQATNADLHKLLPSREKIDVLSCSLKSRHKKVSPIKVLRIRCHQLPIRSFGDRFFIGQCPRSNAFFLWILVFFKYPLNPFQTTRRPDAIKTYKRPPFPINSAFSLQGNIGREKLCLLHSHSTWKFQ